LGWVRFKRKSGSILLDIPHLFINFNLSDKDISDIINFAQHDFNKISKAHKVLVNYKKNINSLMGFLREAILENWEPDERSTIISNNSDYYLRCGFNSWEELENAWINKSRAS